MFVGDVRCSTTGLGSSWKLSGGSPWSSGPTKASKNPQVRRAVRRSACASVAESCSAAEFGGRQADPAGDRGREQPEGNERRGDPGSARVDDEDEDGGHDGDGNATPHLPVEPREVEGVAGLGLGGRHPLEEVPPGDVQPGERPHDGVQHQPAVVGEERDAEDHVGRGEGDVGPHGPQVAALGDALPLRQESGQDGQRLGDDDRDQHERGPQACGDRWDRPGRHERGEGERGREGPAQVVDHLPAGDAGRGPPGPPARGVAGPAKDPGQELPVAARPAVLAGRRHEVVRGELVEELDVRHETGPGEDALEQVVAQQRVLGYPVRHRRGEGVEIVDSLAGVAPLVEQILVDIRHGRRVRVDAGRAGVDLLVEGSFTLDREGRRDPWLEHAVPLGHPASPWIEGRPVERMGDRSHEAADRAAGQPRIGVERDHVAHVHGRDRRRPPRGKDAGRRRAAQKGVQLVELASLALPAHPASLGFVPGALPVEQQEPGASSGGFAVAVVEAFDPRRSGREEVVVAGEMLGGCVEPVREQGEPNVAIAVSQVVDLEAADLGFDISLARQEHRHDDQRPQPGWHALVQVEPRQRPRAQHVGDHPVDEGDREVGGRAEGEDRHDDDRGTRGACVRGQEDRQGDDERRDQRERPEVAPRAGPDVGAPQPAGERHANVEGTLEREAAIGDQVVARVSVSRGKRRLDISARRRGFRHRSGRGSDLDLGQAGAPCHLLDGVPVAVSRGKVHLPKRAAGPQDVVDHADALDELGPVEPRDEAHARDHVSDGHVHRRLALVLQAYRLLGAGPLRRQELLQPAQGGGDRRVLVTQALEQLDAGRRRERRGRESAEGCRRSLRSVGAEAEQAVGDLVGRLPGRAAAHDLLREAAEVVDKENPQADGDRPQLADRERLHLLVRAHHAPQALRVETAVRVRDIGPGEAQDPRVPCEMTVGQLGELAVVVRGQVVADLAELFVDDGEVVDEPLCGRRDRSFVLDRPGQDAVRLHQDAAVLGDAGPDGMTAPRPVGDRLGGCQRPGVLLEPFHAEELGEDRLLELRLRASPPTVATRRVSESLVRLHVPPSRVA